MAGLEVSTEGGRLLRLPSAAAAERFRQVHAAVRHRELNREAGGDSLHVRIGAALDLGTVEDALPQVIVS